jgi:hypothetical protein
METWKIIYHCPQHEFGCKFEGTKQDVIKHVRDVHDECAPSANSAVWNNWRVV